MTNREYRFLLSEFDRFVLNVENDFCARSGGLSGRDGFFNQVFPRFHFAKIFSFLLGVVEKSHL